MKPLSRRYHRRSVPSRSEANFFKKESRHEQSFFGEVSHDAFFPPALTATQSIQRKCEDCEKEDKVQRVEDKKEEEKKVMRAEDKKDEEKVQKKETGTQATSTTGINSYVSSLNGRGNPLPATANYFFSSRLGYDFSNVKVHNDKAAAASAKNINAKAYTIGNNIVFNDGQYNTESVEGKKLMAHELVHVMQQRSVNRIIQRDVAIEPVASEAAINLSRSEIVGALAHNRRWLTDSAIISELRDILGISPTPAVIDEEFVKAVARWQAGNGITQDGRIGRVTAIYLAEEMEQEGFPVLAQQFRGLFSPTKVFDIDNRFCGCQPDLIDVILENLFMINEYQTCGSNPANTTGSKIEDCVKLSLINQGFNPVVAGSTSSTGNVQVATVPGQCGPLMTSEVFIHEWSHDTHRRELVRRFGTGAAFSNAWDNASDWVSDEIRSRVVENNYLNWLINRIDNNCP